jgi:putative pyruvate formate lyase activating enzyme
LRYQVIPDGLENVKNIMEFLAEEVSINTYVNIMDQYFPSGKVSEKKYQEINRRPYSNEIEIVEKIARQKSLQRFDKRAVQHCAIFK